MFHEILYKNQLVTDSKPYVLSFGQGTTEEKLLGGIDVKKFTDYGEIEYLLKNAFISYEVVIFEELFDAFPGVLLILKDILQSRIVRMGTQQQPIKTKMIIACTNRSREEVVTDLSTQALMERFLFEVSVSWSSHSPGDYLEALTRSTGEEYNVLMDSVCTTASKSNTANHTLSPRTVVKAYKSALINGLESLESIYGFNPTFVKAEMKAFDIKIKAFNEAQLISEALSKSQAIYQAIEDSKSSIKLIEAAKAIHLIKESISKVKVMDLNVKLYNANIYEINRMITKLYKSSKSFINKPKKGTLAYEIYASDPNKLNELLEKVQIRNYEEDEIITEVQDSI